MRARPAIWIDRLTTALLALSVGVVSGVAGPALLRAAGVPLPSFATEEATDPHAVSPHAFPPIALPHQAPQLLQSPELFVDPDADGDGDDMPPPGAPEVGLTRDTLTLHERPSGSSDVVGHLPEGEMVTILRSVDDWVLVYFSGPTGALLGYVKKSEIAVR